MPGIGPRAYLYRWPSDEVVDSASSTVAVDETSLLQARPSRYDSYLRDIDGSTPLTLTFTGNVLGADYPFDIETDQGEVHNLNEARKVKRIIANGFLDEWLTENVVIFSPINTDLLFFYFPDDAGEIRRIKGALRTHSYRERGSLPGDIPATLADVNALVYQIKVRDVLSEIQYHLLEPTIDGGLTWQFWSFAEVFNYLRERITKFLLETKLIKDRTTLSLVAGVNTYDLDPLLVDLYRVYGAEAGGVIARTDRWTLDGCNADWESDTATNPRLFIEDPINPLSMRVTPQPTAPSTLKYHYIKQTPLSSALTEADLGVIADPLRIPSIFAAGIKYGVMADMLSRQGEGNDPKRAAYCETRFSDYLDLAQLFTGEKPQDS